MKMTAITKMANGKEVEVRILREEKRYGDDVYIVCKSSAPTNHYTFYVQKDAVTFN